MVGISLVFDGSELSTFAKQFDPKRSVLLGFKPITTIRISAHECHEEEAAFKPSAVNRPLGVLFGEFD
jgi:hypothetical protein